MGQLSKRMVPSTLMAVAALVAACGGGPSATPAAATPGATPAAATPVATPGATGPAGAAVAVTLQEWAVVPDVQSAPAGTVAFTATNSGPEDEHEFVVIKTDLDPAALPTDETGAVVEGGEGMVVINEIEDLVVGATEVLTVDLAAGKYVLICNIYTAAEQEAHYQKGMRIAFTVE